MNVVLAIMLALSASAGEREDALLSAVRKGDVAAVKALLDQGVPVDTRFRYDRTALSFAEGFFPVRGPEAVEKSRTGHLGTSRRSP